MRSKPRLVLILALVILALGMGLWFGVDRQNQSRKALTASGTVEATEAQLGFPTSGRIENVIVHEGEEVKTGAELATMDRVETLARRQQALAQVVEARALLQELERGFRSEEVAQGRAALAAAEERFNDARRDLERTKQLFDGGAVSQEAYDKAQVAFDVAKSQYDQAQEQMRILETGPRKEKIEAQRAGLAQAEAAVHTIDATLSNMVIRAPFDGLITVRHREPGEIVQAGSPILTLMNRNDRWVRIYIPENRIGALHVDQSAAIMSDTYPAKTYPGKVIFIGTEAEFTPKTIQTTEERVKLVYAVKVRITEDPAYELKPGMPADVRLELGGP
jgi:HlyD family secretion protein